MIQRFSKEEFKKIIATAIEEAKKEENIEVNFYQLGFIELYNYIKEQGYCLVKKSATDNQKYSLSIPISPLLTIAYYNMSAGFALPETKSAHLILKPKFFYPKLGLDHQLTKALITSYHEFYHIYQTYNDRQDDYHNAVYQIEEIIQKNKYYNYYKNHQYFLLEIEATKYAVTKTEKFLQENDESCKNIYKQDKIYIEYCKKKSEYSEKNYDLNLLLGIIHKIVIDDPTVINETFLTSIYDEKGNFKNISTILQDSQFKNLDQRIQYEIISSDFFLKTINFDNISSTEFAYVQQALKYRLDLAIERRNYNHNSLKEQVISPATWIKHDCDLTNMLSNLMILSDRLIRKNYRKDLITSIDNVSAISKNKEYIEDAVMHR